jgi:thiamine biosynthesis lipoprotein
MNSLFRSFYINCEAKHNLDLGVKLAVLILLCVPVSALADWYGDARAMMGTEVSVFLWSDDPKTGNALLEEVFQEAVRIDHLMSTYRDDSEISKINRQAAQSDLEIGDELFELITQSIEISTLTGGAFDITYDSVGQHFDFRRQQRPDAETTALELENINFRYLELNTAARTIGFTKNGVRINLGGIAKGYVVERGVDILRRSGVQNAIVTAGGDSRLLGDRRGRPWMVGIRDPRKDGKVAISVPLEDEAISTSGDYERFFEEDGVRYHHIIQPVTGAPAGEVHSATVFGPDAVFTDALSTSVFVMGVDKGLRLIATLAEYESIVIDTNGQVFYSDGLQQPVKPAAD